MPKTPAAADAADAPTEIIAPAPTTVEPATTPDPSDDPMWEGSLSATEPQVAPDGHVILSQADIDAQA